MTFSFSALAVILLTSVVFDLYTKRLPNWLTLGAAVLGLALSTINGGVTLVNSLLGLLLAAAVGWSFWAAGMVGGGDHKLLMAVGALVGYPLILPVMLGIALTGGVQAGLWIILKRQSWRGVPIPYSIAIAVGTLLVLVLKNF